MSASQSASPLVGDTEISNCLSPMTQPSTQPGVEGPLERQGPHISEESQLFKDSSARISLEEQTSQANKGESFSHVPAAVATVPALAVQDSQMSQTGDDKILQTKNKAIPKYKNEVKTTVSEETKAPERFEFEMQYGLSSTTFTNVIIEILSDLATYNNINNWDEKLFTGPLKPIIKVVHKSWGENRCTSSSLITHSTVEETLSIDGITTTPGITEFGVVDSYLLFTKVSPHLLL